MENIINHIYNLIKSKAVKMIENDKKLLTNYVYKVVLLLVKYYGNNIIKQIKLNNGQDIFSIIVLLLPYFTLTKINIIINLTEILNKSDDNILENTYYIDHNYPIDINTYLENSYKLIEMTLYKIHCKLMPNWINIFPVLKRNINNNKLYLDLVENLKSKTQIEPLIGYSTIYGVVYQFLYKDIKNIKWMIYDINDNTNIQPFIIYACNKMGISKIIYIIDEVQLKNSEQFNIFKEKWQSICNNPDEFIKFKYLILFCYSKYKNKKNNKLNNIEEKINNDVDEDELKILTDTINYDELLDIANKLTYLTIYKYIYECIRQIDYTWYGSFIYIIDDTTKNKFICLYDDFYYKYCNRDKCNLNFKYDTEDYFITMKMIYNYSKFLVYKTNPYEILSYSNSWNELDFINKKIFKEKINKSENFNVRNKNILKELYIDDNSNEIISLIYNKFLTENFYIYIIFETLIINGILNEFIFNPILTDKNNPELPDKNKNNIEWQNYMKNNIKKNALKYNESYNYINNTKYTECKSINKDGKYILSFDYLMESMWVVLFGADWLCQIQQFHHFIHNRVLLITGGTGVGKSTVYPMIMLYSHKIINYNNNAKICCTVPRKNVANKAVDRMSRQMGLYMNNENDISTVNYVQILTGDKNITDNKYHLSITFLTDAIILGQITNSPLLLNNGENIYDMIMIDEAHENNQNMTMILTLIKFSLYMNNNISLAIISATMENDEKTYRHFYNEIDDNYKYPLDIYLIEQQINRQLIDKRMHMGVPFLETNFEIVEENDVYNKIPTIKNEIDILKYIIAKYPDKGDILIFKKSEAEIIKMVDLINNNTDLPNDLYAIPFFSNLNENIKSKIEEIDNINKRKELSYPKNIQINNPLITTSKVNEEPYNRFVIVATNIAEASTTINNLSFVIDDGQRMILQYNEKVQNIS